MSRGSTAPGVVAPFNAEYLAKAPGLLAATIAELRYLSVIEHYRSHFRGLEPCMGRGQFRLNDGDLREVAPDPRLSFDAPARGVESPLKGPIVLNETIGPSGIDPDVQALGVSPGHPLALLGCGLLACLFLGWGWRHRRSLRASLGGR